MSNLGAIILRVRTERGMSLQDVADEARLTKAHIWELEKGRSRNPTVETLLGIAAALEYSPIKLAAAAFEDLPGVYVSKRRGRE
jgi:transcriptional regulator with XRE-family HTH domain